jgi:hypothetical protein
MLFMPANSFCSLLYFDYVLDVVLDSEQIVIGVLFNPK